MRRLNAVFGATFNLLVCFDAMAAAGSEAPVLGAAEASICIPSVGAHCASNGVNTPRSPNLSLLGRFTDQLPSNITRSVVHSPEEGHGLLFGPQRPRLALRLYYLIKSQELLLFGAAVLCTVVLLRMLVVPGRVWGRLWGLGRHVSSMLFWTFVLVTAAPAALALCFISGASFLMVGATMLLLLLR